MSKSLNHVIGCEASPGIQGHSVQQIAVAIEESAQRNEFVFIAEQLGMLPDARDRVTSATTKRLATHSQAGLE
ncbi:MAG: hypothetical protein R3C05_29550 [Pirellulaceae bacterium]